mgnify:CR=1 FL=1
MKLNYKVVFIILILSALLIASCGKKSVDTTDKVKDSSQKSMVDASVCERLGNQRYEKNEYGQFVNYSLKEEKNQ